MIGQRFKTNGFGWIEIIGIEEQGAVKIRFDDTGSTRVVDSWEAKSGSVRDLYAKTVAGIGFLGEGEHKTCTSAGINSRAYSSWRGMLARVSDEKFIFEDWLCFQVFADWFYTNERKGYRMSAVPSEDGTRYYSPETCEFKQRVREVSRDVTFNGDRPKLDIMTALRLRGKNIDLNAVASI